MNYVWEALLTADEEGIDPRELRFIPAQNASPYVEVSFADLNRTGLEDTRVEVNPLYRFSTLFEEIFAPDNQKYEKLREIFLDVFMHYVAETDLRSGMHKQEYYFWFLLEELQKGMFGERAAAAIQLFDKRERRLIVTSLLGLYQSACYEEVFRQLIKNIYKNAIIYAGRDKADAIYLYVGEKETETERNRIRFLIDTFLTLNVDTQIFYDRHFGILDVESTMKMDAILLI